MCVCMTNLDSILKSSDITFSSSYIQMWELDHKEGWAPKNWCFQTVVLEKTLDSPLDCKEIKPVNPKGNQQQRDLSDNMEQFVLSCSVVSDSLRPHGLQPTRLPYPSLTPRAYSNSCPSSRWCHPTISSCVVFILLPSILPSIRDSSNESVLHIRGPKYWSFSFSICPSNEYSGLISFRTEW